jgi:predicted negative regulator of RcsB-dependent stress response
MSQNLPVILIEVVLIFGGVLAFAWWQLRDVRKSQEQSARARAQRLQAEGSNGGAV